MTSTIKKYFPEIIGSLLCLTLGMLSGYSVKIADPQWYTHLSKPVFNPPAWIFGPVWTILYLMMGAALGTLWRNKLKNEHLILVFKVQLIFNLLWSPIFFYYQRIGWAFLDIVALWISLVVFMVLARKQRPVFLLFSPYFAWVSFALILNFMLYVMNGM